MKGNRKTEVKASDVVDSFNELADRALPRVVVSLGADVKAEVAC